MVPSSSVPVHKIKGPLKSTRTLSEILNIFAIKCRDFFYENSIKVPLKRFQFLPFLAFKRKK